MDACCLYPASLPAISSLQFLLHANLVHHQNRSRRPSNDSVCLSTFHSCQSHNKYSSSTSQSMSAAYYLCRCRRSQNVLRYSQLHLSHTQTLTDLLPLRGTRTSRSLGTYAGIHKQPPHTCQALPLSLPPRLLSPHSIENNKTRPVRKCTAMATTHAGKVQPRRAT